MMGLAADGLAAGLQFTTRAAYREERRRSWAGFGPGEKEPLFFYPKVFSIFVLQIHFAVSETI
jgi:hypothetical protein